MLDYRGLETEKIILCWEKGSRSEVSREWSLHFNDLEHVASAQKFLGSTCCRHTAGRVCLTPALAHTEEGKKELLFLSNANPGQLERLCAYL